MSREPESSASSVHAPGSGQASEARVGQPVCQPVGQPITHLGSSRRPAASGREHHHRVRASIRAVVAFALVWAVLAVSSWLILPRLAGSDAEWVVLLTAVLMFMIAAGVGWVEYVRSLRRLRTGVDEG